MTLSVDAKGRAHVKTVRVAVGLAIISSLMLSGCGAPQATGEPLQTQETQELEAASTPQVSSLNALQAWAESGDVGAQYDLGLSLADSEPKTASRWFEGLALQGYGPAAYQMGLMQSEPKRAVEWFSMASAMDHIGAQYQLGDAYLKGRGTAKEPEWGMMWFERAARAGSTQAQRGLAAALASGVAGPMQRREALMWLLIAERQDRSADDDEINALKARLNSTAVTLAGQQAEAWVKVTGSNEIGDRATVRFTQYALSRLGFDPGYADGIDGERTYDAIVAFRKVENLGGGGIDGALLDRLRERLSALKR